MTIEDFVNNFVSAIPDQEPDEDTTTFHVSVGAWPIDAGCKGNYRDMNATTVIENFGYEIIKEWHCYSQYDEVKICFLVK